MLGGGDFALERKSRVRVAVVEESSSGDGCIH